MLAVATFGFKFNSAVAEKTSSIPEENCESAIKIPAQHYPVSDHEWESGLQHQWREWKYHLFIEVNSRLKLLGRKNHISLLNHKPCSLLYTVTADGKVLELRFDHLRSDEKYESLVLSAMSSMKGSTYLKFPEGTTHRWISDEYTFGLARKKVKQGELERMQKKKLNDFLNGKTNSFEGFDAARSSGER